MANFNDVIKSFLEGAQEGQSAGQGNLRIKGDVLVHYTTPILERCKGKYILNNTRYSIVTGRLQKQIRELVDEDAITIVTKVPEGYKGSLRDFLDK